MCSERVPSRSDRKKPIDSELVVVACWQAHATRKLLNDATGHKYSGGVKLVRDRWVILYLGDIVRFES